MSEEQTGITKWLEEQKETIVTSYLPATANEKEFLAGLRLVVLSNKEVRGAMRTESGLANLACEFRKAASWGISVNPADGFVSFYPQDGRVIAHLDAAGLREKVIRDGAARECRTRVIYENDELDLVESDEGDNYTLKKALKDPGPIAGFFVSLKLHDGTTRCHYMTAEQAANWAQRFSMKKDGGLKPLPRDNPEGYGQKTVLRQLLTKLRIRGYDEADIEAEPAEVEAGAAEVIDPQAPAGPEDVKKALEAETEHDEDGVVDEGTHGENGELPLGEEPY